MTVHAILAGPVKDPTRNRTVLHGAVEVTRRGLAMRTNDDRHVRLTFDSSADMTRLAADLLFMAGAPTELVADVLDQARVLRARGGE